MNFAVFIRSIGERTEKLCHDSIRKYIPEENIHILKNYYPSYKAFIKMFKIAKKNKYDWYLGIDADVVLVENWWDIFIDYINNKDTSNLFRFCFYTKDRITNQNLVRGNNWYNGNYTDLSLKFLKQNIRIGRFWFYYKKKQLSTGYFKKPETSIRTHMKEKLNILDIAYDETIGWHGYEQYFSEIFRQYITRYNRDPLFDQQPERGFLNIKIQDKLIKENDLDKYIANIAWNSAKNWNINRIDGRLIKKIKGYLEKNNFFEKEVLNLSIEEFYKKYSIKKKSSDQKIHIS